MINLNVKKKFAYILQNFLHSRMKAIKFLLLASLSVGLTYLLDNKLGKIPPLGKFLDPVHGFWANAESNGEASSEISSAYLREAVTVIYDSLQIPHIFAQNDDDLYFAQGYVTAINRLWQMEFTSLAAAGRLSEIVGEQAVDFDRDKRRKGMGFGAEQALQKMMKNPVTRRVIESYAAGVNFYISSLDYKDYPIEYKLLDYAPEPWAPIKSFLMAKNMSNTLNVSNKDLQNTNFFNLYGIEMLDLLYPDHALDQDHVVDNPGGWNFEPVSISDSIPMAVPEGLIRDTLLESSDLEVGSNNWAINGNKSSTGSPILSSDPHLDLSLPSIWYAIQLNAPGVNVMGVSLPAIPEVIYGFNDSIAWGMTNAPRDLVDWYKVKFKDNSMNEYLLDGKWIPTTKVVEEIKRRGDDSYYDTLIYTHWGPVYFDKNFRPDSELSGYAFQWQAHQASDETHAFYLLNRAHNHRDYMAAMDYYAGPAQNFAFASVSGDIAIRVQGNYPVRRKNEGRFLMDGTVSSSGWQAVIPNEHNIQILNPERGFISSANQYPVDSTYPYYITARNYETYRNRRINKLLDSLNNISPEDVMKMQNDNFNLKAAEVLPTMLEYLDSDILDGEEKRGYDILSSWSYYNDADLEGASYFEEWYDSMFSTIWDEIRNSEVVLYYPSAYTTVKLIKENPNLEFFDNQETNEKENAGDIIKLSFSKAIKGIIKWKTDHGSDIVRWADYKNTNILHLLQLAPFSRHVQNGGNHNIINATSERKGPSWRMVVSLEPTGVKAWGVYPGGQSGNPGSKFYDNFIERWEEASPYPLQFMQNADAGFDENSIKLTLIPLNK